jgi:hypothetical protein
VLHNGVRHGHSVIDPARDRRYHPAVVVLLNHRLLNHRLLNHRLLNHRLVNHRLPKNEQPGRQRYAKSKDK